MKTIILDSEHYALVDDDWFPVLSKFKWYFTGQYAARDTGGRKHKSHVYMHRFIMMAPEGVEVDHINHNKLDNRTENLRVVRRNENMYNRPRQANNTTGFKGVAIDRTRGRYIASITKDRKQYNLGRYDTPEEAALAYNQAAIELFGEYAYLNDV